MRSSPSHKRYLAAGCTMTRTEVGKPNAGGTTEIHFYGPCRVCGAEMRDVDEHGYEAVLASPYTEDYYGGRDPTHCTNCAFIAYRNACDLTGRMARCYCGKEQPSSWGLAFFEYQGIGSMWQTDHCDLCGFAKIAHDLGAEHMKRIEKDGRTHWQRFMEEHGGIHEFTPRTEGRDHDTFYDGCRGWD